MKNLVLLLVAVSSLAGCGFQEIPRSNNTVEAALSEVTNQYKRRSDLIPGLVQVVSGYAKHEKETLTGVAEARAKATSVSIDPAHVTPDQLAKFTQAQGQFSQALGRLMMVTEKYPDLKADVQFQELQAQLEGTENRIAIARARYIDTIKDFNNLVTVPPTSWTNSIMYHFEKKPQFQLDENENKKVEQAPEIKF
jgi:LemA protein